MIVHKSIFRSALALVSLALVGAAKTPDRPATPEKPKTFSDLFEGLEFRNIGPYRGGRVTAVTGVRHDPLTFYFGGDRRRRLEDDRRRLELGGRLGQGLQDRIDRRDRRLRIGSRTSSTSARASRRSAATSRTATACTSRPTAGRTWKNVGLEETRQIARVRDPSDESRPRLRRGAGARLGPESGARRSTAPRTAARRWKKSPVRRRQDRRVRPLDGPAQSAHRCTRRSGRSCGSRGSSSTGGPGSALWKSTDGGDTWKKLTEGLPEETVGQGRRRGFGRASRAASSRSSRRRTRAASSAATTAARSGRTSTTSTRSASAPGTTTWIYPDPKNADTRLPAERRASTSRPTAARRSRTSRVPHGDNHDLWIDPDDPNRMILGNDGGATITFNGGRTWSTQNNQPTAQFYRVTTDDRFPYWVYGSQQDNSNVCIPIGRSGRRDRPRPTGTRPAAARAAGWRPTRRIPTSSTRASTAARSRATTTARGRRARSWRGRSSPTATRRGPEVPVPVERADPALAATTRRRCTTRRRSCCAAATRARRGRRCRPDLTRNDPSKQGKSGGPITSDITGVEVYDTIFALAESPLEPGVLWAGSDDGLVHVTRDDGEDLAERDAARASRSGSRSTRSTPRRTRRARPTSRRRCTSSTTSARTSTRPPTTGRRGRRSSTGIPDDAFTRVVREDPVRQGLLYAGTETGLYVSFDDGASWQPFQRNLPVDAGHRPADQERRPRRRDAGPRVLDPRRPDAAAAVEERVGVRRPRISSRRGRPCACRRREADDEDDAAAGGRDEHARTASLVDYWLKDKPKENEKVTLEILRRRHGHPRPSRARSRRRTRT